MSGGNGQPTAFTVAITGVADREYQAAIVRAYTHGQGRALLEAMGRVWVRLERDPRGFGEPLYDLRQMRMQIRCGVVSPLYVEYGVHDERLLVVVRRVVWMAAPSAG